MKFCPKCGTPINQGMNMCQNCGEVIDNPTSDEINMKINAQVLPSVIEQQSKIAIPPVMEQPSPIAVPPVMEQPSPIAVPPVMEQSPTMEVPPVMEQSPTMEVPPVMEQSPTMEVPPVMEQQSTMEAPSVIVQHVVETPGQQITQPVEENKKKEKKPKEATVELTPEEKEKKFNRIITSTILVVSIIGIAVMTFFLLSGFNKNNSKENDKNKNATKYNYEGFDFFLPEGVIGSVEDENLVLRDKENTWSAVITIENGTYNTLVSNKSQLASYYENMGYESETFSEQEVSGVSFITSEVLMGSKNILVAYAKASGTKVYGILYTNELGTYDDVSLKVIGDILASTINSGYDSAIPEGLDFVKFKETFEVAR